MLTSVLWVVAATPASAAGDPCVDAFDCFRLSAQFNGGAPYQRGTTIDFSTDTSTYGLQTSERHNCSGPNNTIVYGDKSAWLRFDARVDGKLAVSASTPAFSSLLLDYFSEHDSPIDYKSVSDLRADDCSGSGNTPSLTDRPVFAGKPFFVQLLANCGTVTAGQPDPCSKAATKGGAASLHFVFTPNDEDRDGVPDTDDKCLGVSARTADGCPVITPPDEDQDGVADANDKCKGENAKGFDRDGDGCIDNSDADPLRDNVDKCPFEDSRGFDGNSDGCIDDSDGDGKKDNVDRCRLVPGGRDDLDNNGCADPGRLHAYVRGLPVRVGSQVRLSLRLTAGNANQSLEKGTIVTISCTGSPRCRTRHRLVSRSTSPVTVPAIIRVPRRGTVIVTVVAKSPNNAPVFNQVKLRRGMTHAQFLKGRREGCVLTTGLGSCP